jgi:hypothetical protein
MNKSFEVSMIGELTYFLGLQFRNLRKAFLFLNLRKDLVKMFSLDGKSHIRTPMSTSVKLDADLADKSVDQALYCNMIESLLYLRLSCPNISLNVGVCAYFQAKPKESHLIAVKRITRYVNETMNHGIWYYKGTSLNIARYSDADWA